MPELDVLEGDEGLGRLLRRVETHGMRRCEREAMDRKSRVERQRSLPSASAAFRYLEIPIRGIAQELGVSRNSVRKYLRSPGVPREKPRSRRASKLDPYTDYIDVRLSEGLDNCVVLLRELRALGYNGGYTILKDYVQPRRRRRLSATGRQPRATVRFETGPGEQAQIDWGSLSYIAEDGRKRRVWAFVMVLSWSRAIYVEFVRRADVTSFMRCHVNAFEYFGGVPRRCLYDNAKVVVLGRGDEGRPEWNSRMLDFALRVASR